MNDTVKQFEHQFLGAGLCVPGGLQTHRRQLESCGDWGAKVLLDAGAALEGSTVSPKKGRFGTKPDRTWGIFDDFVDLVVFHFCITTILYPHSLNSRFHLELGGCEHQSGFLFERQLMFNRELSMDQCPFYSWVEKLSFDQ